LHEQIIEAQRRIAVEHNPDGKGGAHQCPSTWLAASAKAQRICSARPTAPSTLALHSTAANSSPPRRPTRPGAATAPFAVWANNCKTRSPTACPNRSLIDLN
jgi:hypothetical protein